LETQLATAQRLESIGMLASGLAHDFNNVLTAIQASVRLATDDLARDPALVRDALQQIDLACGRAAALTRQLLVFGGEQQLDPRPVSAVRIVDDLAGMLRRVIRESVELVVTHESDHVRLVADPLQIERALVNLCVNASDAVGARGRIVVKTKTVDLDVSPNTPHPEELGGGVWAVLAVEDDGHGIPPDVASRIFEPFFTTKDAARGTGLGLALVFGIVRQHGGAMRVDSKVGVGTTFELWLPAAMGEEQTHSSSALQAMQDGPRGRNDSREPPHRVASSAVHDPTRRAAAPTVLSHPDASRATTMGGVDMGSSAASPPLAGADTKTVLVIEDDPLVRRLVHRILARADYEVVSASSGEEGVEQFAVLHDHIDVVLLDSVLPGISGAEVFAKLRALSPDIPVVFCSGYGDEGVPAGVDIPVLPKPYDRDALIEVLERARTSR
jgi:two-component system cell cycle sensor histidine kinase/response regulator CckA